MRLLSSRRPSAALLAAVCALCLPLGAQARIVNVPADATLQNAVRSALAGDEIIVAPGTYSPTLFLTISANNVTVRGATGNPADVVIQGAGMNVIPANGNTEGFAIYGDGATIRDLTVQEYFYHAIHFQPGADNIHIANVITRNNGQQHIKGARINNGGLIENTVCEQTYVRTNMTNDPRGADYVGGIDLHGGQNFIIRDCIVRNIMGAGGDADGAIFAWNGCANIAVERCIVIGCNRGICFGNNSGGRSGYDVDGGIIRNNFVYARTVAIPLGGSQPWMGNADVAIDVFAARNAKVYNNTVWTDSGSYGRTIRVGTGGSIANSNVQFKYNIIRGNFQAFAGSNYTSTGDITGSVPQASWFVNPAGENFHLTKLAVAALDTAVALPEVADDFDRQLRPSGAAPDKGADELLWGDINGDNACNIFDLLLLANAWNTAQGNPAYSAACDLNSDQAVNIFDLLILADDWNR